MTCPRVIYLDGAGWYAGDGPVRQGMKDAGYPGPVERFGWSLSLPVDLVFSGPDHPKTDELAGRITDLRRANPGGQIVLMGLSSGSAIIIYALEKLTPDVQVDAVVLLSPSISGRTDLREALSHVKGKMFVTINSHDVLLALGESAGSDSGDPAGRTGFLPPADAAFDEPGESYYRQIEYIPWKPEYAEMGWQSGHVGVTSSKFIEFIIAPKIMPKDAGAGYRESVSRTR
jgi:pimeloyl-ACP methyl ester carboxylesterase